MKALKKRFKKLAPTQRLHHSLAPIVALTGGIASGKSTVTSILTQKGYSVIDADKLVKDIYQQADSKKFIQDNFPACWENNSINFQKLRNLFFNDLKAKGDIETFIYAKLPEAFRDASNKIKNQDFIFYDIPLLFEKNLQNKVDAVVVIYTPRILQLERLVKRDAIGEELASKILLNQMDIEEKKKNADIVISNVGSLDKLAAEIDIFLQQIVD